MATLETAKSEDKKVIQNITYKDFVAVCQEYQVVEKSVQELLSIADDFNTEPKEKISIYKWLVEMVIGKPKIITTTETNPVTVEDIMKQFDDPDDIYPDKQQLATGIETN